MEDINKDDKDSPAGSKKAPKKVADKKDEKLVNNTIVINPPLKEAVNDTVVLGWGRMNPITTGHEKLVNKIISVAKSKSATPIVYITHSQDKKKNPLSYNDKVDLARRAFGNVIQKSNSKTIIQVMQELEKRFKNVILVVGSDRVNEFETLLNKYNGKDYSFDSITVQSAGDRDPDADDVSGMSASKMREIAKTDTPKSRTQFGQGLPAKLKRDADAIFDMVRAGMKLAEELEDIDQLDDTDQLDEAVLTLQQRRKRALAMRRYKGKIQAARRRLMRRPATKEKLKVRARKKAIQVIRNMVAGNKGAKYAELSPSEKAQIDTRVQKRKKIIDRLATRLMPKLKRADIQRISKLGQKNESLDDAFDSQFEALFETVDSGNKRYHEARKADGTMKFDKRFRAFKQMKEEQSDSIDDILDAIEAAIDETDMASDKILGVLDEKAEKHDVPLRTLIDIYRNALTESYDYDMTPQQYAFSSVNVFLANLDEGINDPGIFKAVFLAGGPGSGKSFIVGKTALTTMGLKLINSDDAFEHQLKKVGLSTTPEDIYSDLGQSVRGKAKALTAKRQSIALQGRLGLVIDGTGKDFDKIKKQADELKKIGYEVAMVFVNTDLDTAQARNKARTRTLPEDEVKAMWDAVQKNMGKFQNYFGSSFVIVDNSDGSNYEGAVNTAYKKMAAWIKKDPIKPTAKKWIKSQKAERGMKEELQLDESFEAMFENEGEKETAKMRAIKSMMSREKANRQRELAQKARDDGDNEAANKHMDMARKMQREDVQQKAVKSIKEAVASGKQKAALKALMRQALDGKAPKAGYTSSIATNGDFVVYDGGMRIQGRIKKGDFKDPMKG